MTSLSPITVCVRLAVSMLVGAVLGYGRSKKSRAAGFRTYILVSVGACLAMLLSQYESVMLNGTWSHVVSEIGSKYDAARYVTQVISGIGFLAAGTIIANGRKQVNGLTTATGLFASTCLGIATGTGFWQLVVCALIPLIFVLDFSYPLEYNFKRHLRHITLFVRFQRLEDLGNILKLVDGRGAQIFETDLQTEDEDASTSAAIISMRMSKEHASHSEMLSSIAEMPCVVSVEELIS